MSLCLQELRASYCMAVVSSCCEMLSPQRATLILCCAATRSGTQEETASDKLEEGGDDVQVIMARTGRPGLHTCYNGVYRGKRSCEVEQISKSTSRSGLESATRLHEVGIASNRQSECRGEYVPRPCTHRPSHHGSGLYQK